MSHDQPPPGQPPAPPYGAPPGPPYGYAPPPPSSGKATTSLVLGVLSMVMCGLLLGIPAMIVSRQAKREIRESGGRLGGEGVATAGFVTGLIGTIWSVLLVAVLVVLGLAVGGAVHSSFQESCSSTSDGSGGVTVDCG